MAGWRIPLLLALLGGGAALALRPRRRSQLRDREAACPTLRYEVQTEKSKYSDRVSARIFARPVDDPTDYVGFLEAAHDPKTGTYTVAVSDVALHMRRCGLGTKLYTLAAKWGCERGLKLRSDATRTVDSDTFWKKQVQKGRAVCAVRESEWHDPDESDRYVLNRGGCAHYQLLSCPVTDLSGKRGLRGWQEDAAKAEIKRIASTSTTIEEYARRAEAWNASEAKPVSLTLLAKAWAGGRQASKVMELLRQAREQRLKGRERLWSRMSEGLKATFDPRPHYAQKDEAKKRGPVYFVDPETGEYIELDHTTAKYRREGETEFRGRRRR